MYIATYNFTVTYIQYVHMYIYEKIGLICMYKNYELAHVLTFSIITLNSVGLSINYICS